MIGLYYLYNIRVEKFWGAICEYPPVDCTYPFRARFCEWKDENIINLHFYELTNDFIFNLGANGNISDPVDRWILVPSGLNDLPDFRNAIPLGDVYAGNIFV